MKKLITSIATLGFIVSSIFPVVAEARTTTKHPPMGATAICRDGSYSYSLHHRGTCSWHHGVKVWFR